MEYSSLKSLFDQGTGGAIPFDPFWKYLQLLLKWNQKINLTAIRNPEKIIELHFLDSLAALPYLPSSGSLLDFGSGAGFPGIPLKIAGPDIELALAESVRKKCAFLREVVRTLDLKGVTVFDERVTSGSPIGPFDLIVSRGTSPVADLCNLLLPHLNDTGKIMIWKGKDISSELSDAMEVLDQNRRIVEQIPYRLPVSGRENVLVLIK